jgi:hypothetical protein
MPIRAASATADRLTASDNRTIANNAASPFMISCQALNWSDIGLPCWSCSAQFTVMSTD